jgi:adenylylsulfate kinase
VKSGQESSSKQHKTACTIWFTGLSGSGKSTLARALASRLEILAAEYEILDGDEIRQDLSSDLGFSRRDRDENIRRIGFLTRVLNRHNIISLVAAISPYDEMREDVRRRSAKFLQVHVDCALETLIERDTKGFYKKAMAGEIEHFSGISDIYQPPADPDLYFDTGQLTPEECVEIIVLKLQELQWLPHSSETSEATPFRAVGYLTSRIAAIASRNSAGFGNYLHWRVLLAFVLVAVALAVDWTAQLIWGSSSPLVLAVGVALSTSILGLAAGLVAVVTAILAADYFYIAPVFTLTLNRDTFWMSVYFLLIALATHYMARLFKDYKLGSATE